MVDAADSWFDDYAPAEEEVQIDEYDITASPNDFNVMTLFSFMEAGSIKIPGFQRNYVWDLNRASRLIESLVLGIPVPQIFLYEQSRNNFLVIDGQQRLMTIYYFMKMRFPKKDKRSSLRTIFEEEGGIPEEVLHDDEYFTDFKLKLTSSLPGKKSKFHGLNYARLGDYKGQFDLRPLRNIIVKQNAPDDGDSAIFELFNRLNTGGINLRPQEIRASMYHSQFYEMLQRVNFSDQWRKLLQMPEPDIHAKDIEILLRSFAMLVKGSEYKPSMVRFLNAFSKTCKTLKADDIAYFDSLFHSFLKSSEALPEDAFINPRNNRFNIALFEAVFSATCRKAFPERRTIAGELNLKEIEALERDADFVAAAVAGSTHTSNVETRLRQADSHISEL